MKLFRDFKYLPLFLFVVAIIFFLYPVYKSTIMDKNRNRLIELGVARERVYKNCYSEFEEKLRRDWESSDEYRGQKMAVEKCENGQSSTRDSTWARLNAEAKCQNLFSEKIDFEMISTSCSKLADDSEVGMLMTKFRKAIPSAVLTDTELQYIVSKEYNSSK